MSNITSKIVMNEGRAYASLLVSIDVPKRYNSCSLTCKSSDSFVEITSTTAGRINAGVVIISNQEKRFEVMLPRLDDSIECILSYLSENDVLVHYETFKLKLVLPKKKDGSQRVSTIRTVGESFQARLASIEDIRKSKDASKWSVRLDIQDDLRVTIATAGKGRTYGCLGKNSSQLEANDIVVSLDPEFKFFVIPVELMWQHFKSYQEGDSVVFSEIVKADLHSVDNLYYKIPVSNPVSLSNFKRHRPDLLTNFTGPTGLAFNPGEWDLHDVLQLPVNNKHA